LVDNAIGRIDIEAAVRGMRNDESLEDWTAGASQPDEATGAGFHGHVAVDRLVIERTNVGHRAIAGRRRWSGHAN
jgi:hypothetical protein